MGRNPSHYCIKVDEIRKKTEDRMSAKRPGHNLPVPPKYRASWLSKVYPYRLIKSLLGNLSPSL